MTTTRTGVLALVAVLVIAAAMITAAGPDQPATPRTATPAAPATARPAGRASAPLPRTL